jgi:hypothetical protein
MQQPADPASDTNRAIAALTACLVLTLDERDPGFAGAFRAHLGKMHRSMQDYDERPSDAVFDTLTWTDDFIRTPRP